MKKITKGFIVLLAVFLFATGFTAKLASAASYNFYNMKTWETVGYGFTTSGGFVGALQSNLWASRFQTVTGSVDEIFGSGTRQGVINFQRSYGLSADGIVGQGTWGQMEKHTRNLDDFHRVYKDTSATYRVVYAGGTPGGANDYHLENTATGRTIKWGTMWVNGRSIAANNTNEPAISKSYSSHKPSNQEIAELDIPVTIKNNKNISAMSQQDPEILISETGEVKNASLWFYTETNPIVVSESTYESGINIDEMVKRSSSWYPGETVEVIDFKGHPAVVNNSGEGIYEIHIITSKKFFTLGGAEKDVLFSIAEEINFN
ncbi:MULTISPECIES: peptidoglycan-binding domain-containing protein [unclassified Oceanobacillus]|uniref:peptidoglycan-binding domain-containing protein n=1 Tax=unclassified Oceanobacillus TaxID=2630292 RepID=UPI00300E1C9C